MDLRHLEKPGPGELQEIFYAGPLALMNGLRHRDRHSSDPLDRLIAEHEPPVVSRGAMVAFALIYAAIWMTAFGVSWLTYGFAFLVAFLASIAALAISTPLLLAIFDSHNAG